MRYILITLLLLASGTAYAATYTPASGTGTGTGDLKSDGSVAMTGDLDMGGQDITNVGSIGAGTDLTVSSASLRLNPSFAVMNCTNYHQIDMFKNDSTKTFSIDACKVLVSTTSGNTATVTGKLVKVNANGFASADVSYAAYTATAGVEYSTGSFSASIAPGERLRWSTTVSTLMNNDITKVDVWLREN